MQFYTNILATYFPDCDPPYDIYYQQILEQVELMVKKSIRLFAKEVMPAFR